MLYQIGDLTIEISVETYLRMSDSNFEQEIQRLQAFNIGDRINDPFYASSLHSSLENELEDVPELMYINSLNKLKDLDLNIDE